MTRPVSLVGVLAALLGVACASAVPPKPRAPLTIAAPKSSGAETLNAPVAPPTARKNPCFARGVPRLIVAQAPSAPSSCPAIDPALARRLTAELRKLYTPFATGARLDVRFGCAAAGEPPERIVLERGEGHGFTLELWSLELARNHWNARGVLYDGSRWPDTARQRGRGYRIARGGLPLELVSRAAARTRALLASELVEVAPKLPPGSMHGFTIGTSSRNFYRRMLLFASDGGVERIYSGYASIGETSRVHLPLELASEPFETALDALPHDDIEANASDRALFAESFVRSAPRFSDPFWWWVGERQLELAAELGTVDLVPHLLELVKREPAHTRLAQKALIALEAITGFVVSRDADGELVSPARARERVLAECSSGA